MRLKIDVDVDDAAVRNSLRMMQVRSKDFSPVFSRAKEKLEQSNSANFAAGGLPSGGWRPRKSVYGWPIMRRTGNLFNSLANMVGPENVVTPLFARFGTNVEYAKFHQYGTEKMAKRQVLFVPTKFARGVASDAASWMVEGDF